VEDSIVITFIGKVLWPLVAVIALLLFRRPLIRLASEIGLRTKKVSFKGLSFELETLPLLQTSWSVHAGTKTEDVRRLTSSEIFDSYSQSLFDHLVKPGDSDYAIVDLDTGEEWLTSRLYIFAIVLGEVSRLKALVFLETVMGVRRRFLGVTTPLEVRISLARAYPWLEQAFAHAYTSQAQPLGQDLNGQSTLSATSNILSTDQSNAVMMLVRQFVDNIQRKTEPPILEKASYSDFQTTNPSNLTEMVTLWERGEFIDGKKLERDLAGVLQYFWFTDSPDLSQRARIDGILRRKGRFIALVDEDRRFTGLVDRCALLAQRTNETAINNEHNAA
jgi:hypothetical protein